MKALSIALVAVVGLGAADSVLEACGAKFLVSSRAARYQRLQTSEGGSLFLYWNLAPATPEQEQEGRENYEAFRAFLEKVGYSIEATTDANEFRTAARTGDYDIILMPLEAARELRADVAALAPGAALLPVAVFATRAEEAQAEREFGHVLNTPASSQEVLTVLGAALDHRS